MSLTSAPAQRSLPFELQRLVETFQDLSQQQGKAPAISVISQAFAGRSGSDPQSAFLELLRIVNSLETLQAELPEPTRHLAEKIAQRIRNLFEPEILGREFSTYISNQHQNIEFIAEMIGIFEGANGVADPGDSIEQLVDDIAKLQTKFARSPEISDPTKTVLNAQLELLVRSLRRFTVSGLGPFRASVFSIYGRIQLQLDNDEITPPVTKGEILEGMLTLLGAIDAAGKVIGIAGPIAQKLLPDLTGGVNVG